jgi:hypothetical protein
LLLLFVVVNLVTGSRCPVVIGDEVMWTDPAANLCLGRGFTSSVWYFQRPDAFWAGNVPLHPFLLYIWLRLFGFSPLAVRSMAYAMMVGAAVLLWLCVRRRRWIAAPQWRLATVVLTLSGFGVAYGYRSGRPDATTILLACGAAFASSLRRAAARWVTLASLGFLFPWAGLQLAAYGVVLCGVIAAFEGKTFWRDAAFLLLGEVLGAVGLLIFYSMHGVWGDFLRSAIGFHTPLGAMTFSRKLQNARMWFGGLKDPSFLLLALACSIALVNVRDRSKRSRSFLKFGLCSSACIPVAIFLVGFYGIYYSWMVYIPLAVSLCAALELNWRTGLARRARWAVVGILMLTAGLGLPVYCGLSVVNWAARDPARAAWLAEKTLSKKDWVLCQYSAYYGAKRYAQEVFAESISSLTAQEKQRISVLIVRPEDFEDAEQEVGGQWRDTGEGARSRHGSALFGLENSKIFEMYNLEVYRRVSR